MEVCLLRLFALALLRIAKRRRAMGNRKERVHTVFLEEAIHACFTERRERNRGCGRNRRIYRRKQAFMRLDRMMSNAVIDVRTNPKVTILHNVILSRMRSRANCPKGWLLRWPTGAPRKGHPAPKMLTCRENASRFKELGQGENECWTWTSVARTNSSCIMPS